MRRIAFFCCLSMALLANPSPPLHAQAAAPNGVVTIKANHFMRDGKPYQILSGSIHFQRIPRAYWRDRLEKARAMGLNTVTTYVFWNAIEANRGQFDFSGRNDVAAFLRLAHQEGLNVILRPGPYVCAEWDAGGLPAWLFKQPMVKVRTSDPRFLSAVDNYFQHLGQQVAPLMASHGGPVIAVQIENEYGAYGHDRDYLRDIQHGLTRAGLGTNLMFTSDGPQFMANDALDGVLAVVNFGPGNARKAFAALARLRPGQPMMAGEYWAGWYDKVGQPHAHTDGEQEARELSWMLKKGYSFNIYMFEGGTNFGFTNGANVTDPGKTPPHYVPLTTSYDYDAALDEAGRPTPKFWAFRKAIAQATHTRPAAMPAATAFMAVPAVALDESASLWDNLPAPIHADQPAPMIHYGQSSGYILYRKRLSGPINGKLDLGSVRDYAVVYVDQHRRGTVDRQLHQSSLMLSIGAGEHTLDVLVENSGGVNYGPYLADGRAGLVDSVTLDGTTLHDWNVYPLPMPSAAAIHGWTRQPVEGPAFHRGSFMVKQPEDTFWSTTSFGRGFVWVNGRNLGRIWHVGPQQTLYQPAPWLEAGQNSMIVFDLTTRVSPSVTGLRHPIWAVKENVVAH
jgi:beta-galactosidase